MAADGRRSLPLHIPHQESAPEAGGSDYIPHHELVDLITSPITNWLLVDLITFLITNWLLRQVDGQKVWVVKDVKNEPMCGGEGQQRDESPEVLSRSHQAPYRASHGQPMGSVALPGTARPIPAPSLRDARDGAQRRRQTVSRLGTSPRMRNLIR